MKPDVQLAFAREYERRFRMTLLQAPLGPRRFDQLRDTEPVMLGRQY
jgi:hypothetical protein